MEATTAAGNMRWGSTDRNWQGGKFSCNGRHCHKTCHKYKGHGSRSILKAFPECYGVRWVRTISLLVVGLLCSDKQSRRYWWVSLWTGKRMKSCKRKSRNGGAYPTNPSILGCAEFWLVFLAPWLVGLPCQVLEDHVTPHQWDGVPSFLANDRSAIVTHHFQIQDSRFILDRR